MLIEATGDYPSTWSATQAISLVVEHKRKIPDVADSLGIGKSTLQKWLSQYRQEMSGQAPKVGNSLTDEQREL